MTDARKDAEKYAREYLSKEYYSVARESMLADAIAYALERDREEREDIEAWLVKVNKRNGHVALWKCRCGFLDRTWVLPNKVNEYTNKHGWHDTPGKAVKKAVEEMDRKQEQEQEGDSHV